MVVVEVAAVVAAVAVSVIVAVALDKNRMIEQLNEVGWGRYEGKVHLNHDHYYIIKYIIINM